MKKNEVFAVRSLARMAIFTAMTAALSQVSFTVLPGGVPLTLQTLAVALAGYVLGWKRGLISTGVYLLLGAVGLPVFAGLHGGPGVLLGVTGGFLLGFLVLSGLCGAGVQRKNKITAIALGVAGLLVCHVLGVAQFSLVSGRALVESTALVSLPYLIKDVASVVAAYFFAIAIRAALRRAHLLDD